MSYKLYKYMPSEYARNFVEQGEILFRSFSFYKNIEDDNKRGDKHDGSRKLKSSITINGREVPTNGFKIYPLKHHKLFCVSKTLSESLFEEFECDSCVEITDKEKFEQILKDFFSVKTSRYDKLINQRRDLSLDINIKMECGISHKDIEYYDSNEFNGIISMKSESIPSDLFCKDYLTYHHQDEHRYILSIKNVEIGVDANHLEPEVAKEIAVSLESQKKILVSEEIDKDFRVKIGDLRNITKIHSRLK